jgi:hypothetical protein
LSTIAYFGKIRESVKDRYTVQTIAPRNATAVISAAGESATSGASFVRLIAMVRPIKLSRDANGASSRSRSESGAPENSNREFSADNELLVAW